MISRQQTVEQDARQVDMFQTGTLYCDRCHAIERAGSEGDTHRCPMGGRGTLFQHQVDGVLINDSTPHEYLSRRLPGRVLVRVLQRKMRKHETGWYWVRRWGIRDDFGICSFHLDSSGRLKQEHSATERWDFLLDV